MSILTKGMKCRICGRPMSAKQSLVYFSPLVTDPNHPLNFFSDGTFHRACVDNHPEGSAALSFQKMLNEHSEPANRICCITGALIENFDDYFGVGFLTDDRNYAAFEYNCMHFSRKALSSWPRFNQLLSSLVELSAARNDLDFGLLRLIKNLELVRNEPP